MRTELAIIVLAAGAVAAETAFADTLTKSSETALAKMLDLVAPSGDRIGAIQYGEVASGAVFTVPFEGNRTEEYYVNAICDDDCTDLNLAMLDASGVEIDVDDAEDAAPVVNIMPDLYRSPIERPTPAPRPMTIEIRMVGCKAATCAFGVMITRTE